MKVDRETKQVTQMEPEEVALFVLYRAQAVEPNGLTRDRLPYTPKMDALLQQYNQQARRQISHHELWEKMKQVLKCGEEYIEQYLRASNITFPPKH
jgi:hypothetical protein